eukprot:scaffold207949_cov22-Tisochrysis_lutea.AAC.2
MECIPCLSVILRAHIVATANSSLAKPIVSPYAVLPSFVLLHPTMSTFRIHEARMRWQQQPLAAIELE